MIWGYPYFFGNIHISIYPKWRICILEPCLSRGPFIKTKTSMTLPMGETMVWWKTEFLHQLRYVNSPGLNLGIFNHAIYQLVWSPWLLPSTVRVAKGFFRSPTWLTEPRRYSNTLKAWSHWKLPGKPPGSWSGWWAQLSWWTVTGDFFST